jgi:hypothetical protein
MVPQRMEFTFQTVQIIDLYGFKLLPVMQGQEQTV